MSVCECECVCVCVCVPLLMGCSSSGSSAPLFNGLASYSVLSDCWCFCGVLSWKRFSSFWPCSLLLHWVAFPKSIVSLS